MVSGTARSSRDCCFAAGINVLPCCCASRVIVNRHSPASQLCISGTCVKRTESVLRHVLCIGRLLRWISLSKGERPIYSPDCQSWLTLSQLLCSGLPPWSSAPSTQSPHYLARSCKTSLACADLRVMAQSPTKAVRGCRRQAALPATVPARRVAEAVWIEGYQACERAREGARC